MNSIEFSKHLFDCYEKYKEKSFKDKFIKHDQVLELIKSKNNFYSEVVGHSTLGKEIRLLKFGEGKKKIFLWSQMHGDEPTATMAIFDILNYISENQNSPEIKLIFQNTSLYFLPIVNPDGCDNFTRRNIFGIDLNRDAIKLEAVESKILKNTRDKIHPDFGFNLHDQDPRYTVGRIGECSAIALLAPTINFEKQENPIFNRAKNVAAHLANILKNFIPNNLSRYMDDFEPRAFGDNFQIWGTSTVLVESGGWPNDENKFFIRKLNFVGLLSIIFAISNDEYQNTNLKEYESLKTNEKFLYDFIFRNIEILHEDKKIKCDIGLNYDDSKRELLRVMEIGDLEIYKAFNDCDAKSIKIKTDELKWDMVLKVDEFKKIFRL